MLKSIAAGLLIAAAVSTQGVGVELVQIVTSRPS
jgi:hypothetical protein